MANEKGQCLFLHFIFGDKKGPFYAQTKRAFFQVNGLQRGFLGGGNQRSSRSSMSGCCFQEGRKITRMPPAIPQRRGRLKSTGAEGPEETIGPLLPELLSGIGVRGASAVDRCGESGKGEMSGEAGRVAGSAWVCRLSSRERVSAGPLRSRSTTTSLSDPDLACLGWGGSSKEKGPETGSTSFSITRGMVGGLVVLRNDFLGKVNSRKEIWKKLEIVMGPP